MAEAKKLTGFAAIDKALIYFETAGMGDPFIMIHAGVADSRQWNNEFDFFKQRYHVIRHDMRGYGKSEPLEGEFSHLQDLIELLDYLKIDRPVIIMGCSMGGGVAMNLALSRPSMVKALIMVGSGPPGLELDVPTPEKFREAEKAFEAGDLDLTAEIETQIWFDGIGRSPTQVNRVMRELAFEMDRTALAHEVKGLGKRLPDTQDKAADRLNELKIPVLVIVGAHDTPYMLAAADIMAEKIPSARKAVIRDAAHLPNLDHPEEFRLIISNFLKEFTS